MEQAGDSVSVQSSVPVTLAQPGATRFWLAVRLIGAGTGVSAAALTMLLQAVQHLLWPGSGTSLLDAAAQAGPWRHVLVLLGAGVLTGIGQIVLVRLSSGNGIDITEAIWFSAGRLPAIRTLGSAVLSVILVGMGVSLGREGAPKQVGAVIANAVSDRGRLSDNQRCLLVACGAGAGMAAAYGVPLGGALFALEVLRGALTLRMVLPALLTTLIATAVSWVALPDASSRARSTRRGSPKSKSKHGAKRAICRPADAGAMRPEILHSVVCGGVPTFWPVGAMVVTVSRISPVDARH